MPHQWLPEKIATDCVGCPKFRQCAQFAMALPLRGRSLRTTPAGQRPYLAMPDVFTSVLPEPPLVRAIVPMKRVWLILVEGFPARASRGSPADR